MPSESINDQLRNMKRSSDALDQSIGLNRILLTLIDNQKRTQRWMCILLIVSLLCNVAISAIFVAYESQFTTTETSTEVVTVNQDSGDGNSNNVYQSGENAQYVQGDLEEVNANGETDDNNNPDYNPDKNPEEPGQQE